MDWLKHCLKPLLSDERGWLVHRFLSLTDHQNMVLAAASFMLGKGLYSMSYYHDSYRIYPYQITYTKKGNISYAGQVLDETNPVIYTVWVEPCGG